VESGPRTRRSVQWGPRLPLPETQDKARALSHATGRAGELELTVLIRAGLCRPPFSHAAGRAAGLRLTVLVTRLGVQRPSLSHASGRAGKGSAYRLVHTPGRAAKGNLSHASGRAAGTQLTKAHTHGACRARPSDTRRGVQRGPCLPSLSHARGVQLN